MAVKRKKPYFMSQDYFRYKRLGKRWRKPRGLQNKLRLKKGGSGKMVRIGYGADASIRTLARVGNEYLKPVLISCIKDLDTVKKDEIALLSGRLGAKKVLVIKAAAQQKGIKFLYTNRFHTAEKTKDMIAKRKVKKVKKEQHKHEKKHEETEPVKEHDNIEKGAQ